MSLDDIFCAWAWRSCCSSSLGELLQHDGPRLVSRRFAARLISMKHDISSRMVSQSVSSKKLPAFFGCCEVESTCPRVHLSVTRAIACLKWTCRLHSAEHADRPKGNDAFGKSENDESMTLFQVVIEAWTAFEVGFCILEPGRCRNACRLKSRAAAASPHEEQVYSGNVSWHEQ